MIDPISAENRGNYTCTVENPAGTVNFTTSLNINGKLQDVSWTLISSFPFFFLLSEALHIFLLIRNRHHMLVIRMVFNLSSPDFF